MYVSVNLDILASFVVVIVVVVLVFPSFKIGGRGAQGAGQLATSSSVTSVRPARSGGGEVVPVLSGYDRGCGR